MKKVWLGLLIAILIAGVGWWAFGSGGGGPRVRTVKLSVLAQKLYGVGSGGVVRVQEGDKVTLSITADESMEVFLHGYDLEIRVKPGETGTIQFTANITGLHALMIHTVGEGEDERKVEVLLGLVDVSPKR